MERLELERLVLERFGLELMERLRRLGLPPAAWLTILTALGGGGGTLAAAFSALAGGPGIDRQSLATALLLTSLVVASWVWPLVIYRNEITDASEAVHLDEGFLVLMAIALPAPTVVVGFAIAMLVAQSIRRRPWFKSLFNFGQILSSIGCALVAFHALGGNVGTTTPGVLVAASLAALVFFIVNTLALAAILLTTGAPIRSALRDGLEIRLLLVGASVAFGLLGALAITAHSWALLVAVVPMLILRQVLAGHFRARHDRARLKGLLDATLEAHRAIEDGRVSDVLLDSARALLRCPSAELVDQPAEGTVSVPMESGGKWLEVAGRSRTEPFDDADRALLSALAAVGSGALNNATLFDEVRYQRNRLEAITSSLGEGVCAVDSEGCLTFSNPAADEMNVGLANV